MKAAVAYRLENDWEYESKHKPEWHKESRSNLPMIVGWPSIGEEQSPKNIGAISVIHVDRLTLDEKHSLRALLDRGDRERAVHISAWEGAIIGLTERGTVAPIHSRKVPHAATVSSFLQRICDDFRPFLQDEPDPFYEHLKSIRERRNTIYADKQQWVDFISSRRASLLSDVRDLREDMYLAAINKIKQLGRYSEGWDGFDAKAPTAKAIEDAEVFIQKLRQGNLKLPYISLATDGEINFLWKQNSIHLDLGFYGNGTYSYYGRTTTGEEHFEDDVPVNSPLPRSILTLLAHA